MVVFMPFAGSPASSRRTVLEWKRRVLWANPERNRFVTMLAEQLSRTPRKVLRAAGVTRTGIVLPNRQRQRVTILVEVVEHAVQLSKLLPGWALLHAIPSEAEPVEEETDPDEGPAPGQIATLVYTAGDGIGCDILVRATGGTGRLDWRYVRGSGVSGARPGLVIDLTDEFDDRARADAATRRKEYRQQGLVVRTGGKQQAT